MKFFFKLFSIIFIFLAVIFFIDNFKLTEYLTCKKDREKLDKLTKELGNETDKEDLISQSKKRSYRIEELDDSKKSDE